jgi:nitrate reductase cytochrome c-type subunit
MQIRSRDVLFVGIVLVVVAGLYFLSTRGRVPALPASVPEHQTARAREECLQCHLPEQMSELEAARKHPLKWRDAKVSCLQCHQAPAPQKAQVLSPTLKSQIANLKPSNVWLKQQ